MSILSGFGGKLVEKNIGLDSCIKSVEYVRGLYRYPKRMIGRMIPNTESSTDILVIAAHPDDEILGVGTKLYRHRQAGDNVVVAYVTNGTAGEGASWKKKMKDSQIISDIRYKEGIQALSLIDVPRTNTLCLGYPDLGTHRYLNNIANDVQILIKKLKPKIIYVHCMEAGHSDHDMTSFVVKSVCKKLRFSNVLEWAEYNRLQPIGTKKISFVNSRPINTEEIIIDISDKERALKKEMLACHESQGVVEHFLMGEAIRKAKMDNLESELLDYSQFPEGRLRPLIKSFAKYMEDVVVNNVSNYDIHNKSDNEMVY